MMQRQEKHKQVIDQFLDYLYENQFHQPFILKGGSSLMRYYGLDRFSKELI